MPAEIRLYHAERGEKVPRATQVTLVAHRFAKGKGRSETAKDKFIYHQCVLVEWDHGQYCTVVEMATLNGTKRFRCLYQKDRDEKTPKMIATLPACMVAPWREEFAEGRISDVAVRNAEEFKVFIDKRECLTS